MIFGLPVPLCFTVNFHLTLLHHALPFPDIVHYHRTDRDLDVGRGRVFGWADDYCMNRIMLLVTVPIMYISSCLQCWPQATMS